MSSKAKRHPRRLQVFSLDPAADIQLETSRISRAVLNVSWENLQPGPIGDYLEVVDCDPSSGCVYDPVDLDAHLATDGLSPSTGNPQFHQQMVYAVVMNTIGKFEKVLGRRVTWSERSRDADGDYIKTTEERFVQRLRIYPHALRQQNAFYSPAKKALLFGYFNAPTTDPREELPGGLVFTCLSHDIIVHETTHAILDGIHPRLLEATNPDMLAFHEAFADVVAILQHFTVPGLLLDQIQRTRGELHRNNLLAQLATQFARSTDRGNALRNALGETDADGNRTAPDPQAYGRTREPHARGAIMVAAVFDAFLQIYEHRVVDLRRIATEGTGVLPEGDIHPDLARRFADEAVLAASRVLTICIRAIDYLPPVDITIGDYLRALITADADASPDDPHRYRLAFIEAFRNRGIYPLDVRTLSEESLRWSQPDEPQQRTLQEFLPPTNVLRTMAYAYEASGRFVKDVIKRFEGAVAGKDAPSGGEQSEGFWQALCRHDFDQAALDFLSATWGLTSRTEPTEDTPEARTQEFHNRCKLNRVFAIFLYKWVAETAQYRAAQQDNAGYEQLKEVTRTLGLDLDRLLTASKEKGGFLEVHSVRPTLRNHPDGRTKLELLIVLTQGVWTELKDDDGNPKTDAHGDPLQCKYRGGCTLILDVETGTIEYAIAKRLTSLRRFKRMQSFFMQHYADDEQSAVARFGLTREAAGQRQQIEPLALVHGTHDDGGLY